MSKNEKQYIDIYLKNKNKGIDWQAIIKELRMFICTCDDNKLDDLKWEILRYKKSYDVSDWYVLYSIGIAIMAIFFSVFDFHQYTQSFGEINYLLLLAQLPVAVFFALIPFVVDAARSKRKGHYFDIFSQLINEEIEERKKKTELEEKRVYSQERLEQIVEILDSRSSLKRLGSLFKWK